MTQKKRKSVAVAQKFFAFGEVNRARANGGSWYPFVQSAPDMRVWALINDDSSLVFTPFIPHVTRQCKCKSKRKLALAV
jgi:hypothetical protein